VFLVLMLQELTEMTKVFITQFAMVGELRHSLSSTPTVLEEGDAAHEIAHHLLTSRKVVNLSSSVVLASTAAAAAALNVLNGIRPGLEPRVAANGAGNILGTMNLHVHFEAVLVGELALANSADEARRMTVAVISPAHAVATTCIVSLSPLIAAEIPAVTVVSTLSTMPTHDLDSLSKNDKQSHQQGKNRGF
jgi:hypothetical protein